MAEAFQRAVAELKPVQGFESIYAVSSGGAVFRVKHDRRSPVGKRLQPYSDRYGYLRVNLRAPGVMKPTLVHSIVAAAFLGPRPIGMTVNHKNIDRQDNAATNLEYLSSGDNSRHAAQLGRRRGESNANAKLDANDVQQIRHLYAIGSWTQVALAAMFGVSQVQISNVVRAKRGGWSHL